MSFTIGQTGASESVGGDYFLLGGFWSVAASAAPLAPLSPPVDPVGSHLAKNRYLSLVVPSAGVGEETAIRVRLTSLHHPAGPADAPNFMAYEGQYRYLNSFRDGNDNPVFSCLDSAAEGTFYNCAVLGCAPEYRDWAAHFGGEPVHLTGSAVVPSSQYQVAQLAALCAGNEAACSAVSAELSVATERWGNVDNVPAGGAPSALDIAELVDKARSLPGAMAESRCQLQGALPNPYAAAVSAQDIARIVDAVKGAPYPFTIAACP
jgi:hypothetical protein